MSWWTPLKFLSLLLQKVKLKAKLSLYFNWAPRHEGILGEWRYSCTHSWSALDGGELSASLTGHFTPRERAPGSIRQEAGWAPEPFWTRWWKEKFPAPAGIRNPVHQDCTPAIYHWAILAPIKISKHTLLVLYVIYLYDSFRRYSNAAWR
jgi:hypothetical protein